MTIVQRIFVHGHLYMCTSSFSLQTSSFPYFLSLDGLINSAAFKAVHPIHYLTVMIPVRHAVFYYIHNLLFACPLFLLLKRVK